MKASLRQVRRLADISQQRLGQRAGVSQARVSALERGYANPTSTEATRIERVLGAEGLIDWEAGCPVGKGSAR